MRIDFACGTMNDILPSIALRNDVRTFNLLWIREDKDALKDYKEGLTYGVRELKEVNPDYDYPFENMRRKDNEIIALSSIVTYGSHKFKAHIPQLDLDKGFEDVAKNMNYLRDALGAMHSDTTLKGVIVQSGSESFHYHGYDLLNEKEWQKWMQRAQSLDGLVDKTWCDRQLRRGFSALRLTSSKHRPIVPKSLFYVVTE